MYGMELARRNQKLTQRDVGHDPEVGIDQTYISAFETGKAMPTPEQAVRLARKLGIDVADLLKPVVVANEEKVNA